MSEPARPAPPPAPEATRPPACPSEGVPADDYPLGVVRVAALIDEFGDHPTPDFTLLLGRIAGRPEFAVWCTRVAWRAFEPVTGPDARLAIRAYDPEELLSAKAEQLRLRSSEAAAVHGAMRREPLWRKCAESLRIPPILLCGPAGVGKRRFVEALARALGVETVVFPMERMTAPMLHGWPPLGWPEGEPGGGPGWPVVTFVRGSPDAVYLLEGLDRYPKDARGDWIEPLRSMLDPEAAARFTDRAVQVAVNLSAIRWVATCEDLSGIPPELLARFEVFSIKPPEPGDAP